VADLKGKSLSVGAPKYGTSQLSARYSAAAGMTDKDIAMVGRIICVRRIRRPDEDIASSRRSCIGPGPRRASLKDPRTLGRHITVCRCRRRSSNKIGPPFVSVTIPANTYAGPDKDVRPTRPDEQLI